MEKTLLPASPTRANEHESVLTPGAVLQDRYLIIRALGRGGMGAVYEAIDQRLDATVALKETLSAGDRLRRQFEQEARLLAQLHHPALPRVSDYFTQGDRAFLVMQFISGNDLAEIISKQPGPFPRQQVIAWADQLLDALVYLHTRNRQIIHRDIKPHNLKLTASGQIALLDFGLAKAESSDRSAATSSRSIFGYTRRYSPLEQIQDQGTTPQSDIYALGATLYHLLTGVKPADALTRAAALVNSKPDPLKPAEEIHAAVGPEISAILCRAMAQNPEDRFPNAKEFREALRQVGRRRGRDDEGSSFALTALPENETAASVSIKRRNSTIDPFESYSILKPDDMAWLIPKPSRRPFAITALFALLLVAGGGAYFNRHWIESATSGMDYATSPASKKDVGAAVVHQSKTEKSRSNGPANVSAAATNDPALKKEKKDRAQLRPDRNHPNKPNAVTPRLALPPVDTSGSSH